MWLAKRKLNHPVKRHFFYLVCKTRTFLQSVCQKPEWTGLQLETEFKNSRATTKHMKINQQAIHKPRITNSGIKGLTYLCTRRRARIGSSHTRLTNHKQAQVS